MVIKYECRHCHTGLGFLPAEQVDFKRLGVLQLSPEEQNNLISYDEQGSISISVICEDCQEALRFNPNLHGYEYIIQ
ncbi:anti-sigma-F factor Fin [Bacillus testis]|uniref:anti-sigma-F factor Fin n=1 Tax=Bacillus testis TaxID=1622072 RepID=UPI00067E8540|nr:anti-sigma-F factor Fin [Bacillus testis]